jgi:two-component system cell cycle response regulator DivK
MPTREDDALGYSPRTVLIIEDEPNNRTFLLDLLIAFGYSTLVAIDGEEGLQLGLNTRPDLILMDLGLPGMDGWTLIRRLKEHVDYGEERARNAGCDAYLTKPVKTQELLRVLEGFLKTGGEVL